MHGMALENTITKKEVKDMAKISVIIPIYNAEKYLHECLDSVLRQTERDVQIICVDDGSTDASYNILKAYAESDSRIEIAKGHSKGGGAARNVGMAMAKGEYIAFLDADDYMDETFLEKMYQKGSMEKADIVVCGVYFLYQATGALRSVNDGLREENLPDKDVFSYKDMKSYIFNTFHNWAWNKMFRREFIEKHKLQFQEILRSNDLLFTCKALVEAKRITTVKEHLITYRIDEGGNSCQNTNEVQMYGFYEAFLALKKYLLEKEVYEDVKQSFVNHALDGCIANLNTMEFTEAHKELFEKLKQEIFVALDIVDYKDGYYRYNIESKTVDRYEHVISGGYESYLRYRAEEIQRLFSGLQHDIYFTDCRVAELEKRKEDLSQEIVHLKIALQYIDNDRKYLEDDNRAVYESFSYRFGHTVTAIPRWMYRKLRGR